MKILNQRWVQTTQQHLINMASYFLLGHTKLSIDTTFTLFFLEYFKYLTKVGLKQIPVFSQIVIWISQTLSIIHDKCYELKVGFVHTIHNLKSYDCWIENKIISYSVIFMYSLRIFLSSCATNWQLMKFAKKNLMMNTQQA